MLQGKGVMLCFQKTVFGALMHIIVEIADKYLRENTYSVIC